MEEGRGWESRVQVNERVNFLAVREVCGQTNWMSWWDKHTRKLPHGLWGNVRATKFFKERESQMTLKSLSPPSESVIPLVPKNENVFLMLNATYLELHVSHSIVLKWSQNWSKNSGHRKFEHI